MAWIGSIFLKILGWRIEGEVPDIKKFVIIAAPHTTNWDFPITLAGTFVLKIKIYWMGKAAIFRWPFGAVCRWLGGIPIERSQSKNVVEQTVNAFNEMDNLIMIIPPEGSRKKVSYWKIGFYHIAKGANVPIVLGFLDYRRKVGGIGTSFIPRGVLKKICRRSRLSMPPSQENIIICSAMLHSSNSASSKYVYLSESGN